MALMVPKLSRLAVLVSPSNAVMHGRMLGTLEPVTRKLGISVLTFNASSAIEIRNAVAAMSRERAQALIVLPDSILALHFGEIARLAAQVRLPSAYSRREYPEAGGLMSYGQDTNENWRLGAKFIDYIFKGTNPDDLPFEQPTNFELVLNLKTARSIGARIPDSLRIRATKVIE